ncbi:MBOAT family O-acyltransferase [Flexithrix dorotheae]|uniref:MBOAT family O-acyltransferase n=1 Tax=Flexithrix dorotheae TaxID=70993 RepID=UPI001FDF8214|nr:MBOAT family protein [Flexithrix dorotheae]
MSRIWLLLASIFFYGWWNPAYVLLIVGSIVFNFFVGKAILKGTHTFTRKAFLALGVISNVSLLFYYKYADFFVSNVNTILGENYPLLHLALPLGISFFTFQQIAFLVDNYKYKIEKYNFINYGVFVSFFPQLIAGPIVHHAEMMPQFKEESTYNIKPENINKGLFIFILGLSKKLVIADTFGVIANNGYANISLLSSLEAWITSLAYSVQLYFDFSGYSDMAIGLGLLFNIHIPINFWSPYKSKNIQEFWRRWHITLGSFLRDYVYIPLGGNRKGEGRTYFNLFMTFVIGGIWHGAGWNFVVWGALHGLALVVHRFYNRLRFKLPKLAGVVITFLFVNLAWVFFRASSWGDATEILSKMFSYEKGAVTFNLIGSLYDIPVWLIGCLLLFMPNTFQWSEKFKPSVLYLFTMVTLVILNITYMNSVVKQEFLYFDF